MKVRIVGGGLAGSEAAWQLAKRGIPVELFEMRPLVMTEAHTTGLLGELVCSNSLRSDALENAVGLLKEELRVLGSIVMMAADRHRIPAGSALAVDRKKFSECIDDTLRSHPLVEVSNGEVCEIPEVSPDSPLVMAPGPLVSRRLAASIEALTGEGNFSFYDAISPIVLGSSIDKKRVFMASRWDKGTGRDYLNIPLDEDLYLRFVEELKAAEKFSLHGDLDDVSASGIKPFEGCMPIEDMVERGRDTLLFGPLKPVGLLDPGTERRPFAVLQLRKDDSEGRLWSMVGMQTRMTQREQRRIFSMLPGLEKAEFVRLGSVHRNSFINSPCCLSPTLEFRGLPGLFFGGQITGVEGYVESAAAGLLAGINAAMTVEKRPPVILSPNTATGALVHYISNPERRDFQPMNVNFGLMPSYLEAVEKRGRVSKRKLRMQTAENALSTLRLQMEGDSCLR